MSTCLKATEIVVRVTVMIIQTLGIIGGFVLIGVLPRNSITFSVSIPVIVLAVIVMIYELIMTGVIFSESVSHSARLLADISIHSVAAGVYSLVSLALIAITVFLAVVLVEFEGGLIAGSLLALPIAYGVLSSIVFIASAISSGVILSKTDSTEERDVSRPV